MARRVPLIALASSMLVALGCDSIIEPICSHECASVGETRCSGGLGLQTCEDGPVGCKVWSAAVECADPDVSPCIEASCNNGVCGESRPSEVSCDDGLSCTASDVCDSGTCGGTAKDAECDDGDWCNGPEVCAPADSSSDVTTGCRSGAAPQAPADDDASDCWLPGSCDPSSESFPLVPVEFGASCDDAVACTLDDRCDNVGACSGDPNDGACADDTLCNGSEICHGEKGCLPGDELVCDDGLFCTGVETCDPKTGCVSGEAPAIDDQLDCTLDGCDDDLNVVTHEPIDAECDDGAWCNGAETCDAETGCVDGTTVDVDDGVECTIDLCDEENDVVLNPLDDSLCDDGEWCNGAETCAPSAPGALFDGCLPAAPIDADDGVPCTLDVCDEDTGSVAHTPSDEACDDGLWCNGPETCDAVNDCEPGVPVDVDDGIECTLDLCDEDGDTVTHPPSDEACDDGQYCNGAETCAPSAPGALMDGCLPAADVAIDDGVDCTVDACDEDNDTVTNTLDDGACDDELWCNGAETCTGTGCEDGVAADPDDSVACTVDTCDEDNDTVVNVPDDSACDDTLWCNGVELCNPSDPLALLSGCVIAEPPNAPDDDDLEDCLVPGPCDEEADAFTPVPIEVGEGCDDGIACTTDDDCAAGGICAGNPEDGLCDDGQTCTSDTCDPSADCVNEAAPGPCDDGLPCTTGDVCSDGVCTASAIVCDDADDCTSDACDPAYGCVHVWQCTAECGCLTAASGGCSATADGLACDDGDPQTVGDFCLAGVCAGFTDTRVGGPGYGLMTILELEEIDGTIWALGRTGSDYQTSWPSPTVPGQGVSHVYANRVLTKLYQLSGAGIAIGSSIPRSLRSGSWSSEPALVSALGLAGVAFGSYGAIWGDRSETGDQVIYLAGRSPTFQTAPFAKCTKPPAADWTCEELGYVWTPDPAATSSANGALTPQRLHAASLQSDLFLFGTIKNTSQEQKYSTGHLPLGEPATTEFQGHGWWSSNSGTGFMTDADGIGSEPGELWSVGTIGFLATPNGAGDPSSFYWKGSVLAQQSKLFFMSTAADESGQFVVSERIDSAADGSSVYVQDLHFHVAGSDTGAWTRVELDRRAATCVAPSCPAVLSSSYPLEAMEAAPGRLVIAGAEWDASDGQLYARTLERITDDQCPGTLVAASFDDGTPGSLQATSTDPLVAWQASSFTPPGGSGPFLGALWFGDSNTGNYVGTGGPVSGTLSTGDLVVPSTGSTFLSFHVWWDTETSGNPKYDQLSVSVNCDSPTCPGPPKAIVAQSKTGSAPVKRTWYPFEVSLNAWQGESIEVRVEFDTVDSIGNTYPGVFVDDLRIVTTCPADDCSDCTDTNPCTVDGCWLGRCQHVQQCQVYPLTAGFDDAAVVEGKRSLRSIGWGSDHWTLGAPGDPLQGIWATVAPTPPAVDTAYALAARPIVLTAAGESLDFAYAFETGGGAQDSLLALRATSLDDGSTIDLWTSDASGTGEAESVTVSLDALTVAVPWQLTWTAELKPGHDITWRVRL